MVAALEYLGHLPDETLVYNGHEYTQDNLAFGKHVDPANVGIATLEEIAKKNAIRTGITTIGNEKEWNVFMRLDSPAVRYATPIRLFPSCCLWSVTNRKTLSASDATPKSTLMDMLRAQKNEFKAA